MAEPDAPRLVSLRSRLFLRFALLVGVSALLFLLGHAYFSVRPTIAQIAEGRFATAVADIDHHLGEMIKHSSDALALARHWAIDPGFHTDRVDAFNRLFLPVLVESPNVTSVVAGTTAGEGWLLLQLPDGAWRNRITDIARHGRNQRLREWSARGPVREWTESRDYDPRVRPWFQRAMEHPADRTVHWTAPYTFFSTREPGITASTRVDLADGRSLVVGLDLKLREISDATQTVDLGARGRAVVMSADERLLAVPRRPPGEPPITSELLMPVDSLGTGPALDGINAWRTAGRPAGRILHYSYGGEHWLAQMRTFQLGEQTLWVAVFAPERDFTPAWGPVVGTVASVVLAVLLLALALARRQAAQFTEPLDAVAEESRRIAQLDFAAPRPPQSRLREIRALVHAQEAMRERLREFHDTVEQQSLHLWQQLDTLRQTEGELRDSERRLKAALEQQDAIFENALVGIMFVRHRVIVDCNRRLGELLGEEHKALTGQSTEIYYPDRDTFVGIGKRIYETLARGENFLEELWLKRKDGSLFWGHLSGRALDARSPHEGSVWILADLTERRAAEERLVHLGNHDPLTELPNRLLFHDRLSQAIAHARRDGERIALLFVDLDDFKAVNDSHGHHVGDRLLCAVARRLEGLLRGSDSLARLGGDEFIVLIEGVETAASAGVMAGKILESLDRPFAVDAHEFFVRASIGVCICPDDGVDPDTLVRNADAAMYQAKESGRNTYRFYSEEMTQKAMVRLQLESQMRRAVERDEFRVHLQPLVDLRDGRVAGAEALVRWQHPEMGLVLPHEFIPLAEDTGLILPIGRRVLDESARLWKALRAEGLAPPRFAVNLSVRQFRSDNLPDMIRTVLAEHDVPEGVLELEITESFLLETDGAVETMQGIGALGVTFSLDDFGTGYSSLSYLKRLPFGKLKIDKSFVWEIGRDPGGEAIVRTIVQLAHTLGLDVVAEGVETTEQAEFLEAQGCRLAQGYLYARPMPAEEFRSWLQRRNAARQEPESGR